MRLLLRSAEEEGDPGAVGGSSRLAGGREGGKAGGSHLACLAHPALRDSLWCRPHQRSSLQGGVPIKAGVQSLGHLQTPRMPLMPADRQRRAGAHPAPLRSPAPARRMRTPGCRWRAGGSGTAGRTAACPAGRGAGPAPPGAPAGGRGGCRAAGSRRRQPVPAGAATPLGPGKPGSGPERSVLFAACADTTGSRPLAAADRGAHRQHTHGAGHGKHRPVQPHSQLTAVSLPRSARSSEASPMPWLHGGRHMYGVYSTPAAVPASPSSRATLMGTS